MSEPEDAIPAEFLPEQQEPADAPPARKSDPAFNLVFGLPWLAGAGWLEWNNHGTWWVSALLLSGFGLVGSGFLPRKYADFPIFLCTLTGLALYVYGLVVADSISLRAWLGLWLADALILFGSALPVPAAPATGEVHDRRGRVS